jgi:coenzyme PQQ precursor peptide PqqA
MRGCGGKGRWANLHAGVRRHFPQDTEMKLQWTKPRYEAMRFGFEVTMYASVR